MEDNAKSPHSCGFSHQKPILSYASQSDIIRCLQKDEFYVAAMREYIWAMIATAPSSFPILTIAQKWRQEVNISAEALYYFLTTVRGEKSFGEEYCDLIQVHSTTHLQPLFCSRLTLIFLQLVPQYLLQLILTLACKQKFQRLVHILNIIEEAVLPSTTSSYEIVASLEKNR
uniref:RING-type E3 ubiquitin transferase n=1 Tax=Cardiosporidium cionae TaxID=476202 RepID=A0A3S5HLU6_9APIC|nr:peroxisome biogenesis factor 10 [Cardiosporidium cionae]AZL94267.1 peroxisome biogenesis factor 10 [Cardiosporidium cionae]AZL94268.1 peroxisome biogenesis factor 10 [Cardiosporidium cionae]